jgi:hypothetical protein
LLVSLGVRWGQRSMLFVDASRGAHIQDLPSRHALPGLRHVGRWNEIDSESVHLFDAYTHIPDTNVYYGVL